MALGLGSRPEREDVSDDAGVNLWGRTIGAVSLEEGAAAVFQYEPAFVRSGIQVAPLTMGWCLDCHKKRGVAETTTGTDCARCHY